jgi:DNA-binding transcriptional regulator YhcF (GntR family)
LKGEIDTSFETLQRDLFASGMAAVIGPNAFVVWLAIKAHADNNTGVCWPSVRKLAEVTGLSSPTVQKCLKTLTDANLLRVASGGKGTRSTRYVARERMTVRIGDQVICVIALSEAIKTGSSDPEAFATCDIIPADGFVWDNDSKTLRKRIAVKDLPRVDDTDVVGEIETALSQRVKELEGNAKKRKSR